MQHPEQQLQLHRRRQAREAQPYVVDNRHGEQGGDARRRPQLVRRAQFVVKPQAGVAVLHRRHLGKRSVLSSGILTGYLKKTVRTPPTWRRRGLSTMKHETYKTTNMCFTFNVGVWSLLFVHMFCLVNKVNNVTYYAYYLHFAHFILLK